MYKMQYLFHSVFLKWSKGGKGIKMEGIAFLFLPFRVKWRASLAKFPANLNRRRSALPPPQVPPATLQPFLRPNMSFCTSPPKCLPLYKVVLTLASYAVLSFPEPHIVILSLTAPPMNQASSFLDPPANAGQHRRSHRNRRSGQMVRSWKRSMGNDSHGYKRFKGILRRRRFERMAWIVSLRKWN